MQSFFIKHRKKLSTLITLSNSFLEVGVFTSLIASNLTGSAVVLYFHTMYSNFASLQSPLFSICQSWNGDIVSIFAGKAATSSSTLAYLQHIWEYRKIIDYIWQTIMDFLPHYHLTSRSPKWVVWRQFHWHFWYFIKSTWFCSQNITFILQE